MEIYGAVAPVAPSIGCMRDAIDEARDSTFAEGSFTTTHGSSGDDWARIECLLAGGIVDESMGPVGAYC